MTGHVRRDEEATAALERVVLFSDAVFAIAITLLALDLRVPERLAEAGDAGLVRALADLVPAFGAFVLSFAVIAMFWIGHFRTFRFVRAVNPTLVFVNFAFLACVALLPFPTSVVAHHGDLVAAAVFYAVFLVVASLLSTLLWVYPSRMAGLTASVVTPDLARFVTYRALVVPLLFALSIPIAVFVSPYIAEASWFLAFPAQALVSRRYHLARAFERSASTREG